MTKDAVTAQRYNSLLSKASIDVEEAYTENVNQRRKSVLIEKNAQMEKAINKHRAMQRESQTLLDQGIMSNLQGSVNITKALIERQKTKMAEVGSKMKELKALKEDTIGKKAGIWNGAIQPD